MMVNHCDHSKRHKIQVGPGKYVVYCEKCGHILKTNLSFYHLMKEIKRGE